ncbi:AAA family ATPase [Desulfovermiculus halophilus]|uniref:AAA family ATPase n=1 Tax=Desulfovermiculus halophilus TaxID=339722 RepID=UPI00047FC189|nr:AAA family ATPase [Desulfovermiculus halophilus]
MHIVKLESENIKRLKAVSITPQGNMITIGGQNAQGKSSVLDSIAYALGGKRAVCDRPVRDGQDKARVVCELDDLVVTRTFTKSGGGTLTVSNKDGTRHTSPQRILDQLTGKLTFDPLEFCRMEPRAQVETLKALVGLDFTDMDRERQDLYDARTQVNRDIKKLRAALQDMPAHNDLPQKEITVSDLMTELKGRQEHNRANQAKRDEVHSLETRISKGQEYVTDLQSQIDELQRKLESAQGQLDQLQDSRDALQAEVDTLTDQDEQEILDRMENAQEINRKIQQERDRLRAHEEHGTLETRAQALTNEIQAIDQAKARALHEAHFPVHGLSFDDSGVLLNGLPFSQASQAEQLRVSVAMGFAQNPGLKVLLVRDGSLLDENSLNLLAGLAREYDGQVWIERVGEEDECVVVIEDGMVK